jgi:hypothetical protein
MCRWNVIPNFLFVIINYRLSITWDTCTCTCRYINENCDRVTENSYKHSYHDERTKYVYSNSVRKSSGWTFGCVCVLTSEDSFIWLIFRLHRRSNKSMEVDHFLWFFYLTAVLEIRDRSVITNTSKSSSWRLSNTITVHIFRSLIMIRMFIAIFGYKVSVFYL